MRVLVVLMLVGTVGCLDWDAAGAKAARCRVAPSDDGCADAGGDGGAADAGADAGTDAGSDAGRDGGSDAGADAGTDGGPLWVHAISGTLMIGVPGSGDVATVVGAQGLNTQVGRYGPGGLIAQHFLNGYGFTRASYERDGVLALAGQSLPGADSGFVAYFRADGGQPAPIGSVIPTQSIASAVNLFPTDAGLESAVYGTELPGTSVWIDVFRLDGARTSHFEWRCDGGIRVDRIHFGVEGQDGVVSGAATSGPIGCTNPDLSLNGASGAFLGRFGSGAVAAGPVAANAGVRTALGYTGADTMRLATAGPNVVTVGVVGLPLALGPPFHQFGGDLIPVEIVGRDAQNWWLVGTANGQVTAASVNATAVGRDVFIARVRGGAVDRMWMIGGAGDQFASGAALIDGGVLVVAGQCNVADGGTTAPLCTSGPGAGFVFGVAADE